MPRRDTHSSAHRAGVRADALTAEGELCRSLDELRSDPEGLAGLARELAELRQKLPNELKEGEEALKLDDPRALGAILHEVEQMIVPRLLSRERMP